MAWGVNQASYDIVSNTFNGDAVYVLPKTVLSGSGGTLRRWDVASSIMRDVGTLPSALDLGGSASDTVYVNPLALGTQIGGTAVARITGGQFQSTGSRVYTLQPSATSSLTLTSKKVQ